MEYNKIIKLIHKKCGNGFSINRPIYNLRRNRIQEICLECFPLYNKQWSICEKQVADFVASIYNGEIFFNDRKVIYPCELDIYLPKMDLAFEFNGDFYHANPKFYGLNDTVLGKTAESIWEKDEKKKLRCNKKNIKLVVIWEDDWVNKRNETQNILRWYTQQR